jgi:hypothetical protein
MVTLRSNYVRIGAIDEPWRSRAVPRVVLRARCGPKISFKDNDVKYEVLVAQYMVIWDYWVFGLCSSSSILKNTKEHKVSETGSVFVLR